MKSDLVNSKKILTLISGQVLLKVWLASIIVVVLDLLGISLILPLAKIAADSSLGTNNNILSRISEMFKLSTHTELVMCIALGCCVLFIVKGICVYFSNAFIIRLISKAHRDLTIKMMSKTLQAGYPAFLEESPSEFVSTIQSRAEYVAIGFQALTNLLTDGLMLLLLLVAAAWFQPVATLLLIAGSLLIGVIVKFSVLDKSQALGSRRTDINTEWHKFTFAILTCIKDIKVMGLGKGLEVEFTKLSTAYATARAQFGTNQVLPRIIGEVFFTTAIAVAIALSAKMHSLGAIDLASLVIFGAIVIRILPNITRVYYSLNSMRYSYRVTDLVLETLGFLDQHLVTRTKHELAFKNEIIVDGLYYEFVSGQPVLKNVSTKINRGSFICLIGESGSGKTTLLDVLTGLLPAHKGLFKIDNTRLIHISRTLCSDLLGMYHNKLYLWTRVLASISP